jgi:hypothetical protein
MTNTNGSATATVETLTLPRRPRERRHLKPSPGSGASVTVARSADADSLGSVLAQFQCVWTKYWLNGYEGARLHAVRPEAWEESIAAFLAYGLTRSEIIDSVTATMTRELDRLPWEDRWRYFCGVCWRKLDGKRALKRR